MLGFWWAATHQETFDIDKGGGSGGKQHPQDTFGIGHMLGVWWVATLQETFDIAEGGGLWGQAVSQDTFDIEHVRGLVGSNTPRNF